FGSGRQEDSQPPVTVASGVCDGTTTFPVCGRLMPQLADQAAQTLKHTYTKDVPADTEQPRAHEHP
ncbi:hypothetical protein, partial [Streptomyces sp. NPDC002265]|uniref:hypothetical protein n=1 Tax=Streptomyces sp. NPDC002265 TaxID=3154415 RepID=UPI00331F7184